MVMIIKLITFVSLAIASTADAGQSSAANIAKAYVTKELAFFVEFAQKSSKKASKARLNCSWDNPNRPSECAPVPSSPFDGGGPPPSKAADPEGDNCLHDPDPQECRKLLAAHDVFSETAVMDGEDSPVAVKEEDVEQEEVKQEEAEKDAEEDGDIYPAQAEAAPPAATPVAAPTSAPVKFLNEVPVNVIATEAPTRDDCYGNMFDGRFCASSMPSATDQPTKEPSIRHFVPANLEGSPDGETVDDDSVTPELSSTGGGKVDDESFPMAHSVGGGKIDDDENPSAAPSDALPMKT